MHFEGREVIWTVISMKSLKNLKYGFTSDANEFVNFPLL